MAGMERNREPAKWLPYAGLALAIMGMVYQGGSLSEQIRNQRDRIVKLEATQAALTTTLTDMNIRGAKNEQKLDFLVERAGEIEGRRK